MCAATVATFVAASLLVVGPVAYFILQRAVTDPTLLSQTLALLPWALALVWLTSAGQVFLATLDACQRSHVRVGISLLAAGTQLAAAYHLVPRLGLQGLPLALIAQAAVSLLLGALAAIVILGGQARFWFRPDLQRLREVLSYGGAVQVIAIAQLTFDPVVKLLLSTMSGLSLTGLYEVANKAVIQFRGLIVSAFQMLVPFLAHRIGGGEVSQLALADIYRAVQGVLVLLAVPYYALVAGVLPTLLTLWIGHYDPAFVAIGLICLAGWFANTLAVASYMIYMATGQLRWVVRGHLLIGAASTLLGFLLGAAFGGMGVVTGSMLGLAIGSAIIPVKFHSEYSLPARDFIPGGMAPVATTSAVGLAVLLGMQLNSGPRLSPSLAVTYIIVALACAAAMVRHPVGNEIIRRGLKS